MIHTDAKWCQDMSNNFVLAKAQPRHAAKTQQWKPFPGEASQPASMTLAQTQWLTCKLQIMVNGACNRWTYDTLNSNIYMAQLQKHVWHLDFFRCRFFHGWVSGLFNHGLALKIIGQISLHPCVFGNFDFWMQHVLIHFPLHMEHVILIAFTSPSNWMGNLVSWDLPSWHLRHNNMSKSTLPTLARVA